MFKYVCLYLRIHLYLDIALSFSYSKGLYTYPPRPNLCGLLHDIHGIKKRKNSIVMKEKNSSYFHVYSFHYVCVCINSLKNNLFTKIY